MALVLNEDWTADAVGQMHKYRITNIELAERCVYALDENGKEKSYSPQYVCTVMNGKKEFGSEEAAQKTRDLILSALEKLIDERKSEVEHAGSSDDGDGCIAHPDD